MSEAFSLSRRVVERLRFEATRTWDSGVAVVRANGIHAYWCDCHNFGDHITPMLLRHYGFTPFHALQDKAALISTGSILEHFSEMFSGVIVGSGFLHENSHRLFPKASILAVRGRLTLERLGRSGSGVVLADPGLLAARVIGPREEKRFEVGFIPHYVDKGNPALEKIRRNNQPNVTIINVERKKPLDVFREIDRCRAIISSSLHGLIVADSLGIPTGWMFSPGLEGGRFKFDDYYSSLNLSALNPVEVSGNETLADIVSQATCKSQISIQHAQDELDEIFTNLRRQHFTKAAARENCLGGK
jgi:pyruvyltransferase